MPAEHFGIDITLVMFYRSQPEPNVKVTQNASKSCVCGWYVDVIWNTVFTN